MCTLKLLSLCTHIVKKVYTALTALCLLRTFSLPGFCLTTIPLGYPTYS